MVPLGDDDLRRNRVVICARAERVCETPSLTVRERNPSIGLTIVLSLSWALSFYFYHFGDLKLSVVYGAFATPIALIIWLHWSAKAILIGAEINVNIQAFKLRRASEREQLLQHRADAA